MEMSKVKAIGKEKAGEFNMESMGMMKAKEMPMKTTMREPMMKSMGKTKHGHEITLISRKSK